MRFKAKYTAGEQVTESTSFFKDQRERYELGDIILIKQRDQKRNMQISRSANTYVIVPDDAPAAAAPAAPQPPGVVTVTMSIVDLGERKDVFGQTARRVRTRDRAAAATRRVRSVEAAHRDRCLVHRYAEGAWRRRRRPR